MTPREQEFDTPVDINMSDNRFEAEHSVDWPLFLELFARYDVATMDKVRWRRKAKYKKEGIHNKKRTW